MTTKKDEKNNKNGDLKNKNSDNHKIENDQIKKKLDVNYLDLKNKIIPKVFRQFGGHSAWLRSPSRLELKNLVFSYSSPGTINSNSVDIRPILNNISFSIPPGGYSLGIVGPSGKKNFFLFFYIVQKIIILMYYMNFFSFFTARDLYLFLIVFTLYGINVTVSLLLSSGSRIRKKYYPSRFVRIGTYKKLG